MNTIGCGSRRFLSKGLYPRAPVKAKWLYIVGKEKELLLRNFDLGQCGLRVSMKVSLTNEIMFCRDSRARSKRYQPLQQ